MGHNISVASDVKEIS